MHNFPRKLFTAHLFYSSVLSSARIMILNLLTSCYFFWRFIRPQVICTNVQDKMIRTAPYPWFYVIVHTCCFCTWKGFNKHFAFNLGSIFWTIPIHLGVLPYCLPWHIDFSFFSGFGLLFLWWPAKIVFVSYNYYLKIFRLPCSGWPY